MKKLILPLAMLAATAQAQTWDVDVVMDAPPPFVGSGTTMTFQGSFTVNNGVLANVNVSDPLSGGAFTGGFVNGNGFGLMDYQGETPQQIGSSAYVLSIFPGGIFSVTIDDWNSTGTWECGTPPNIGQRLCPTLSLTDPPRTQAPELSTSTRVIAVTLLLGALAILRGRQRA